MANILMLITNLGKGGAQRVFYDHCIAFANKHHVEEVVFDINEDERIYNSGLPIHSLSIPASKNILPGALKRLSQRAKNLKNLVKRQKSELVISHMDGANLVNVLSGSTAKKILVVHGTILHDFDQQSFMQVLRKKFIIPYLYNKATITVAVSEGIAYELNKHCGVKNVISIPNFFDIQDITKQAQLPLPSEHASLFEQHNILITSGRFADQKKQLSLIPIFKKLIADNPTLKLVFLGDGPLREEMLASAKVHNLSFYEPWSSTAAFHNNYNIYFLGYINNPYQYLKRSTLFLFPSAWEGFPMALCEAMITGVPVLSADCPTGPREILAPGTVDVHYTLSKAENTAYGVLLPMANKPSFEREWTYTIQTLLSSEKDMEEMANAALMHIQQYDKKVVLDRWEKLIKEAINS